MVLHKVYNFYLAKIISIFSVREKKHNAIYWGKSVLLQNGKFQGCGSRRV